MIKRRNSMNLFRVLGGCSGVVTDTSTSPIASATRYLEGGKADIDTGFRELTAEVDIDTRHWPLFASDEILNNRATAHSRRSAYTGRSAVRFRRWAFPGRVRG